MRRIGLWLFANIYLLESAFPFSPEEFLMANILVKYAKYLTDTAVAMSYSTSNTIRHGRGVFWTRTLLMDVII